MGRENKYNKILFKGETIELTAKQDEFARLYAKTGQLTESRSKAGYAKITHESQAAYQLLQKPYIAKAVEYYKTKAAQRLDISENRILAEYAAIAFSNIANLYDEAGNVKDLKDLDPAMQRAVKEVTVKRFKRHDTINIKLHDKQNALDKIAELKGMTAPKDAASQRPIAVQINVSGNGTVTTKEEDDK